MSFTGPLKIHGITDKVANSLAIFITNQLSQDYNINVEVSMSKDSDTFEVVKESNKKSWWNPSNDLIKRKKLYLLCTELSKVHPNFQKGELIRSYEGENEVVFRKSPEEYCLNFSILVEGALFSGHSGFI